MQCEVPENIYTYPTEDTTWANRNSKEGGISKAKIFQGKFETKLEFPVGWEDPNFKNRSWEEYGYFLEQHIGSVLNIFAQITSRQNYSCI